MRWLQTLGEAAAQVAHDFNNVLGALLGRVQLLQHSATDAGVQKALGKMERMIADGEATVKRLQDAARSRRTENESATLDGLVRDVYAHSEAGLRHRNQIDDRKVAWITEFMPTGPVQDVSGRLKAALLQLLKDISSAVPDGSVVELRTLRDRGVDCVTLAVARPEGLTEPAWSWETLTGFKTVGRRGASTGWLPGAAFRPRGRADPHAGAAGCVPG